MKRSLFILFWFCSICCLQNALVASDSPGPAAESSQQLYERLSFTSKKKFIEYVKEDPMLRAKRVEIGASMMELADGHRMPLQQALDLGIPIDQQDGGGATWLMQVSRGFRDDYDRDTPVIKGLLEHHADPTLEDDRGCTALGYALSSDYATRQAYVLSAHPKIAGIINALMVIEDSPKKWLSPLIRRHYGDQYKTAIMKNFLRAGYTVTLDDVVLAAGYCWDPFYKNARWVCCVMHSRSWNKIRGLIDRR